MKGLFILGALLAAACDSNLTTPAATVDTPFAASRQTRSRSVFFRFWAIPDAQRNTDV